MTKLDEADAEIASQRGGLIGQRLLRAQVVSQHTAVYRVRHADEVLAEERAPGQEQRQHAEPAPPLLDDQVV